MTHIDMTHVPYRGAAPAITDLLGGRVQVLFNGVAAVIEHIRAGRLRALAVTSMARVQVLSDIPPVNDFVPGYEVVQWVAIGLRKSTPAEIVERLNHEINAVLGSPNMKMRLADMGIAAFPRSSAELGAFVANETENDEESAIAKQVDPIDFIVEHTGKHMKGADKTSNIAKGTDMLGTRIMSNCWNRSMLSKLSGSRNSFWSNASSALRRRVISLSKMVGEESEVVQFFRDRPARALRAAHRSRRRRHQGPARLASDHRQARRKFPQSQRPSGPAEPLCEFHHLLRDRSHR
jgi:hypothetical protein